MMPIACLICGERDVAAVFTYGAPDAYEAAVGVAHDGYARAWVRCAGCGFHYSRYSRAPDSLDRIYDLEYRNAERSFRPDGPEAAFRKIVALPPEQSESRQRIAAIRGAIARLQDESVLHRWTERPLRLLDVGGASGVFAYLFQDADWRAEIVDPGEQGRFVRSFGIAYHQRRFDESFDGGCYHLLSMNYVLEHSADPRHILTAARERLLPSGLLYVEVPDELAFTRKPLDDDIFNSCHLWMFGPRSLQRLLADAGFEALSLTRGRSPRGHYALAMLAWAP
jgi:hypothetical protein